MLRLYPLPLTTCFAPVDLPLAGEPSAWLVWEDRDMRWAAAAGLLQTSWPRCVAVWQSEHRTPEALAGLVLGLRELGVQLAGQRRLQRLAAQGPRSLHRIARVPPPQMQRWCRKMLQIPVGSTGTKPEHLWPFRPLRDRVAP